MILIKNSLKIDNKEFSFSLIFFNRTFFIKCILKLSQNQIDKNKYLINSLFTCIHFFR